MTAHTNLTTKIRKPFRFTGYHMAAFMVTFFGVIVAVNITMAVTASRSWTGLVVKNSYVASQQFNRDIEAAKLQRASGLSSKITYRDGALSVLIQQGDASVLQLDGAQIEYGRPAFEQKDQRLALQADGKGGYRADVALETGEWFLKITGSADGRPYRRDARLFVRRDGTGDIK
ncbi:MAG: FixH family protein [Pseudomonadota bacterium]